MTLGGSPKLPCASEASTVKHPFHQVALGLGKARKALTCSGIAREGDGKDLHLSLWQSYMITVGKGGIKTSVLLSREQLKRTLKTPHSRGIMVSKEG